MRQKTAGTRFSWYLTRLKIPLKPFGLPLRGRSGPSSVLELGRHLGRKIGAMPVDPLAEREARKAADPNRSAGGLPRFLDHPRYLGFLIDNKNFLEQHDLLVELAQSPVDHLLDDFLRPPGRERLSPQHVALAVKRGSRHRGDVEIERTGCSDMHRQLLAEHRQLVRDDGRSQGDNDADLADSWSECVVNIGEHTSLTGRQPPQPSQYQVFADGRDQISKLRLDRAPGARIGGLLQRRNLAVPIECQPADSPNKALELVVARYEVGLGVDFDDGPDGATCRDPNQTLCGDSPSLAGGRRQTLHPQPVDGPFDIAPGFAERSLAIHHARAGLLAQLLDQRRGYFRHSHQTPV